MTVVERVSLVAWLLVLVIAGIAGLLIERLR